jgi:hypothetical protein
MNATQLGGLVFGKWTVIEKVGVGRGHAMWLCRCECGREQEIHATNLVHGRSKQCKQCWNTTARSPRHPINVAFSHVRGNAFARGVEFNVTKEFVWDVYLKQQGKCALTGIDLKLVSKFKAGYLGSTTASLDRIDSSIGYVEGNIQWVYKPINLMKWKLSTDEFIRLCRLVVERNP